MNQFVSLVAQIGSETRNEAMNEIFGIVWSLSDEDVCLVRDYLRMLIQVITPSADSPGPSPQS